MLAIVLIFIFSILPGVCSLETQGSSRFYLESHKLSIGSASKKRPKGRMSRRKKRTKTRGNRRAAASRWKGRRPGAVGMRRSGTGKGAKEHGKRKRPSWGAAKPSGVTPTPVIQTPAGQQTPPAGPKLPDPPKYDPKTLKGILKNPDQVLTAAALGLAGSDQPVIDVLLTQNNFLKGNPHQERVLWATYSHDMIDIKKGLAVLSENYIQFTIFGCLRQIGMRDFVKPTPDGMQNFLGAGLSLAKDTGGDFINAYAAVLSSVLDTEPKRILDFLNDTTTELKFESDEEKLMKNPKDEELFNRIADVFPNAIPKDFIEKFVKMGNEAAIEKQRVSLMIGANGFGTKASENVFYEDLTGARNFNNEQVDKKSENAIKYKIESLAEGSRIYPKDVNAARDLTTLKAAEGSSIALKKMFEFLKVGTIGTAPDQITLEEEEKTNLGVLLDDLVAKDNKTALKIKGKVLADTELGQISYPGLSVEDFLKSQTGPVEKLIVATGAGEKYVEEVLKEALSDVAFVKSDKIKEFSDVLNDFYEQPTIPPAVKKLLIDFTKEHIKNRGIDDFTPIPFSSVLYRASSKADVDDLTNGITKEDILKKWSSWKQVIAPILALQLFALDY